MSVKRGAIDREAFLAEVCNNLEEALNNTQVCNTHQYDDIVAVDEMEKKKKKKK